MRIRLLGKTFGKNKNYTFRGGIHPEEMKRETEGKPIIDITPQKVLVYPMVQHLGAPAVPCVKVGERVLAGQKIAEAGGFVSAHVHSSVSGMVTAIEPRLHPTGVKVMSIVVENDELYETSDYMKKYDLETVTKEQIIENVREAGIVGMGGATFPTHIKLSPPEDKKIEYIIINGAECEPYLTSDHRAMLETTDEIVNGLKLMLKALDLKTGHIAIETNKPDAIRLLTYRAQLEKEFSIKVVPVKTKYPQGSEKHLIKAVTGKSVPSGKLPVDIGVVVNNVDSCAAVARAVLKGMPLTFRIVTVGGDCIKKPCNLRVPIGTSFARIAEVCGGFTKPVAKLIMGGPMMGIALTDIDVPVIKGSSGLLSFSDELAPKRESQSCLRCGKCVKACPINLLPNVLKEEADKDNFEKLNQLGVMDCIQCGSCAYVCPAEQNPISYIRNAKIKMREASRK